MRVFEIFKNKTISICLIWPFSVLSLKVKIGRTSLQIFLRSLRRNVRLDMSYASRVKLCKFSQRVCTPNLIVVPLYMLRAPSARGPRKHNQHNLC